ncbi:armadillo repeat-containing protein 4-like [Stegodyphus dumicola]|uniref:armadillo repeat-containing protein 4-like n=1 Tax=Stegodyphus dumicola TaxID=202533 RepID=UPI0015B25C0E|nr:armadillo repeat-containing protein 4-like [Stegodyphus dumicola]
MFPRYRFISPLCNKKKAISIVQEADVKSKCSSSESDDLEDIYKRRPSFENYEYPNDYWKLMKSVKYFSYDRPLLTTLALITSYDCDFQDPVMLKCLSHYKVIEILLNVLHSDEKRLQFMALKFLRKLSKIRMLRHEIVYLGGIQSVVKLLSEPQTDIRQAATETITCIADFHKAWRTVQLSGGIPLLVNMIYLPKHLLYEKSEVLSDHLTGIINAAEAAAGALFEVCNCRKNRIELLSSGALRGCQNILKTPHVQLATIIMQLIQRCATYKCVRLAIRNLGMLEDFRSHFYSEDQGLMQAAAQAAFTCAEGDESRQFFGKAGFVDKLFEIIQTSSFHTDHRMMASISGALWKCAENEANVLRLQALNASPLLIQLLASQPVDVQEHLVACLCCCMTNPQTRNTVRKNNGIEMLIGRLHTTAPKLIMYLNRALGIVSRDTECLALLEKHNALRLIWSHLKNDNPSVVSNTAWQLAAILKNIENSAMYVRSLVGGVQLLTELLNSKHTRVLTPICALIIVLSKEPQNLRILSDYHIVKSLSKLTQTKCKRLRYHLCMAITACCPYRNNRQEFAKQQIVFPLIKMLQSRDSVVTGAATHALSQLSIIPKWCAVMYNSPRVYEILLEQMKSKDHDVQECAAEIIQKMRLFALNRDGNIPLWLLEKHSQFFSKQL